ncbi:hypothetical protein TYRP_011544 [Tyrophagus putrescentiae]|nr:hypothetical protein TYRP_011544 [Tyrophagus putrescentiae]
MRRNAASPPFALPLPLLIRSPPDDQSGEEEADGAVEHQYVPLDPVLLRVYHVGDQLGHSAVKVVKVVLCQKANKVGEEDEEDGDPSSPKLLTKKYKHKISNFTFKTKFITKISLKCTSPAKMTFAKQPVDAPSQVRLLEENVLGDSEEVVEEEKEREHDAPEKERKEKQQFQVVLQSIHPLQGDVHREEVAEVVAQQKEKGDSGQRKDGSLHPTAGGDYPGGVLGVPGYFNNSSNNNNNNSKRVHAEAVVQPRSAPDDQAGEEKAHGTVEHLKVSMEPVLLRVDQVGDQLGHSTVKVVKVVLCQNANRVGEEDDKDGDMNGKVLVMKGLRGDAVPGEGELEGVAVQAFVGKESLRFEHVPRISGGKEGDEEASILHHNALIALHHGGALLKKGGKDQHQLREARLEDGRHLEGQLAGTVEIGEVKKVALHLGIRFPILAPKEDGQISVAQLTAKIGVDQAKLPQNGPLLDGDVGAGEDDEEEHVHDHCHEALPKMM